MPKIFTAWNREFIGNPVQTDFNRKWLRFKFQFRFQNSPSEK